MSISQKTAWIQLSIFSLLIITWAVLFGINGTVFFWQDETVKDVFYYTCAGAFAVVFGLNLTVGIATRGRSVLNDERDRAVFRGASYWAAGITLVLVLAALVALTIVYMNRDSATVSVYFPLFIVLVACAVLMLVQALASVIIYARGVHHG